MGYIAGLWRGAYGRDRVGKMDCAQKEFNGIKNDGFLKRQTVIFYPISVKRKLRRCVNTLNYLCGFVEITENDLLLN